MPYYPEFTGPIEGYVVNFSAKHAWRVARLHTVDDLKQEGYLIFLRCALKYSADVEGPAHFMALFKTAWFNHFTDLAREDTANRMFIGEGCLSVNNKHVYSDDGRSGETDNDGYLATMLRQAPREINMVLNLFLNAPQEILDVALSGWRQDKRRKAGGSERICQMLGLDPSKDVLKAVEEYLTH